MLTDTAVRALKPKDKMYRVADQKGLCIEVTPGGAKLWRFRYRFQGKARMLSLGGYPEVTLREAREKLHEKRKLLNQGVDPSQARKEQKIEASSTFEAVAREFLDKTTPTLTPEYAVNITRRLERDVFPFIGTTPIKQVAAPDLLFLARRIEDRGAHDTAKRAIQKCGQIFRYAVACGLADYDTTSALRGALTPRRKKHHASLTDPRDVAALLRAIDGYSGSFITLCALRLALLVFVRPGELRRAEWPEFDFEAREWRITAQKMKMREQHIVPLSRQAIAILKELRPLTGHGRYLFPSVRSDERPMSNNTVNAGLRRLGYSKDEMTGHGFRSMASTLLNELGWSRDAIERQLAHAERDGVRAAYNYAEHLPERRKMMQAWADHLDALKAGSKIIPMRAGQKD